MKNTLYFALLVSAFSCNLHATPLLSAADAALAGGTTITFNDIALGSSPTVNSNGVTFSNAAPAIVPPIQGISIQDSGSGDYYLRYSTSVFPEPEGSVSAIPQVKLRIDFSSPVSAFGLYVSGSYPYSLTAYDDADTAIETFGPTAGSYSNYFMGLSSATNIRYAILGNVNGFDYLNIDNLTYAPAAVPTPPALPLIASGICMLWLARRHRR